MASSTAAIHHDPPSILPAPSTNNLDGSKRPQYNSWAPSSTPVMTNGSPETHRHPIPGSLKPIGSHAQDASEAPKADSLHHPVKLEPSSSAPPYTLPPHPQDPQHSHRPLHSAAYPPNHPNVHYQQVDPGRPGSGPPLHQPLPPPPPHNGQHHHMPPHSHQQQQSQHQAPPPPPPPQQQHHHHPPPHQLPPQHSQMPPQHPAPPPPPPPHTQGQGPGPPPPPPVAYPAVQPYPPPPSIPGGSGVPGQYHHHSAHPPAAGYGPPMHRHMSAGGMMGEDDMNQGMGDMTPVSAGPYGMGGQPYVQQRRKAVRAAQACDACRQRKAKCDEGRPSCSFCKDAGQPCVYREVPPPKQDRTLMQILERLGKIESLINNPDEPEQAVIQLIRQQIAQHAENSGVSLGPNFAKAQTIKTEPPSPQHFRPPLAQASSGREFQTPPIPGSQSNPLPVQTPSQTSRPGVPQSLADTEESEDDQKLTMPLKHNTAAQKLLSWSSIKSLLDGEYADSYVLDEEYARGQLRIFGRGEEDLDRPWSQGEEEYVARPGSSSADDMSRIGLGGGVGLGAQGGLRIDIDTVRELLNSFFANIYLMHPIFDRESLTEMVYEFAETHGAQDTDIAIDESYAHMTPGPPISPHTSFGSVASAGLPPRGDLGPISAPPVPIRSASFSGSLSSPTGSGNKRKRDLNSQAGPPPPPPAPPRRTHSHGYGTEHMQIPQAIPKTMHSATVLMVLALGAITAHRQPVPGPLPSGTKSPVINHSFYPPPETSLPGGGVRLSHGQPSFMGEHLTNVDTTPGLAYFAKAIEILVLYTGSNSVPFVQCALLAGIYWGQLGRVLDSWKWICHACIACQAMMTYKLVRENDPLKKDIMLRVFWSCLQLESDVLAELDLPPSGITRFESSTDLPLGPGPGEPEDVTLWLCYFAQCHLRRILNRVHSWLYKATSTSQMDSNAAVAAANELETQLESWKDTLPPNLQWLDTDPPATDINSARLRAKYYGAKYIIHRPFVQQTINVPPRQHPGPIMASPALSTSEMSHHGSPSTSVTTPITARKPSIIADPVTGQVVVPPSVESSCRKCISAAIQSTSAFHGFNADINRPVVTNIFGTAHAQFGNLLVLQAAYKSPQLRHMVDKEVLKRLLKKTMHFLRTLSPISAALRKDVEILEDASLKMDFMAERS